MHSAVLMAYTALRAVRFGGIVRMLKPTDN
jgi:hypothetical protein